MARRLKTSPGGATLLEKHIACVGCRYDLFHQPLDGQCPECNLPVKRSQLLLSLDGDPEWQLQIENALRLGIYASSGWALCYLLAILDWYFPVTGILLLTAAVATAVAEFRSHAVLWQTPAGCEPLIGRVSAFIGKLFDLIAIAGLVLAGVAGVTGDVDLGWFSCAMAILGSMFLCVGVFRILPLYGIYATVAREIAAERLQRELAWAMVPRLTIEPLLFGCFAYGLAWSTLTHDPWSDPQVAVIWLGIIAYGIALPFQIGSHYDLWKRMRELRLLETSETPVGE